MGHALSGEWTGFLDAIRPTHYCEPNKREETLTGLGGRGTMERKGLVGYNGLAYIMWGSWRIEGQAMIDGEPSGGLGGTFIADSETEPLLLSSLARALHESYRLRIGEEEKHNDPIDISIVGHVGNRINFALLGESK